MMILEVCKLSKEVSLMDNLFQQIDFVYLATEKKGCILEKNYELNP